MKTTLAVLATCLMLTNATQAQSFQTRTLYDVYNRVAATALQKHQVTLAETMLQRALEQCERYGENDGRVITTSVQLANLYASQNEYVLAQPLYDRLVRVAEHQPAYGLLIASALDRYAEMQERTNRSKKAEMTRQLSLVIRSNLQNQPIANGS